MNDAEKLAKLREIVLAMYHGTLHEYHDKYIGGCDFHADYAMSAFNRCQCAQFALASIGEEPQSASVS